MERYVAGECSTHGDPYACPDALVVFVARFQEYGLVIHDGGSSYAGMDYCPWCGTRLPESRRDRWFEEMERLGIDPVRTRCPRSTGTTGGGGGTRGVRQAGVWNSDGVVWRCLGVRWRGGEPCWVWEGGRVSPLPYGRELFFGVVGERLCPGARGNACPVRGVLDGRSTGGLCADCARLDRMMSVAADTVSDDPRVFRVYLAWFGPGLVKVGITAEERGDARLLEQGALAFTWLGRGALMAARRTEVVLGAALGVPDRIPYAVKRAARVADAAGTEEQRAGAVGRVYRDAVGVGAWGDTLERLPLEVRDHTEAFGLARLRRLDGVVRELGDGCVVRGELLGVAGPDLHLRLEDGRFVVLDGRLAAGWAFVRGDAVDDGWGPVVVEAGGSQSGLF
nr:DUF2797 domain-containing protein [Streptomyces sp. MUM 203J]